MDALNSLEQPKLLQEGKSYYLRQARGGSRPAELTLVTLVAYSSCPGTVIVQDASSRRFRCGREELLCAFPARS